MTTETAPDTIERQVNAWVVGRLPDDWFTGGPDVQVDRDEILISGQIADVDLAEDDAAPRRAARQARLSRFREDTRKARVKIAEELEQRTGRKVSWGATCGDEAASFTNLAVPVMTRLRLAERAVLDTLIDGGVARSRSEALAWCVRLVGEHEADWIARLREALVAVEDVRQTGPGA
ncbi:MAG: hypothetical protein ACR2H3_17560 [Acidimicrobiales bacterium]